MKSIKKTGFNPSLKQQALEKLVALCPICQAQPQQLRTSVLFESNQAEYVHINCGSCQGSVVALLFSTGPLISSIGLITDLSQQDAVKFQRSKAISEDDIIGLHELFQQTNVVTRLLQNNIN